MKSNNDLSRWAQTANEGFAMLQSLIENESLQSYARNGCAPDFIKLTSLIQEMENNNIIVRDGQQFVLNLDKNHHPMKTGFTDDQIENMSQQCCFDENPGVDAILFTSIAERFNLLRSHFHKTYDPVLIQYSIELSTACHKIFRGIDMLAARYENEHKQLINASQGTANIHRALGLTITNTNHLRDTLPEDADQKHSFSDKPLTRGTPPANHVTLEEKRDNQLNRENKRCVLL